MINSYSKSDALKKRALWIFFNLLVLERETERSGERATLICMHSLVDSFMCPDQGTLAYQDNALTRWVTWPGLESIFDIHKEFNALDMFSSLKFKQNVWGHTMCLFTTSLRDCWVRCNKTCPLAVPLILLLPFFRGIRLWNWW